MMTLIQGMTRQTTYPAQPSSQMSTVQWTDTGVSWYGDGSVAQMNNGSTDYVWFAIG